MLAHISVNKLNTCSPEANDSTQTRRNMENEPPEANVETRIAGGQC
jgi:hypothetical protein